MNTDLTLERIISLFPASENGKPIRGSSKELTDSLGIPRSTVADWKSGKSKSYRRYLHEIAEIYNVSVEWLRGETDEKTPQELLFGNSKTPLVYVDEEALNAELISRLISLTPEEQKQVDAFVQGLLANR